MTFRPASPPTPLREAHAHISSLGESLRMTDLSACTRLDDCLQLVALAANRARRTGPAPFARLHGARVEAWPEHRWPTLAELDAASGDDVPVVLLSFDHHAAAANSAALRAAALTPGLRVPPNGEVRVDAHGRATGLLIEQAAFRAWSAAPEPDAAGKHALVAAALRHLAAPGFIEVHDLHSQPWLGPMLGSMQRSGELDTLGVREIWLYPNIADADHAESTRDHWSTDRVRLAGFKVFLDGTLNSRTAWMLHPYRDPTPGLPTGKPMLSIPDLRAAIARAQKAGVGLAVHAIGDAAVRAALDTWQSAFHSMPGCLDASMPSPPALRLEHCELVDAADVPRFAELGVVCSVQPCHLLADVEALTRYLPHRLDRVLPLRELVAAGCTPGDLLWFGSDVPIVRADPADSIRAAVERRREGAPQSDAIAWDQRITESQAWQAFHSRSTP